MVASLLLQASDGDPNTQYLPPWAAPECTVVNMNIVCKHMDVRSLTDSFYTSMLMFCFLWRIDRYLPLVRVKSRLGVDSSRLAHLRTSVFFVGETLFSQFLSRASMALPAWAAPESETGVLTT